jgi:hypothetical protein
VHAADADFISLADLLRSAPPAPRHASPAVEPLEPAVPAESLGAAATSAAGSGCACEYAGALRDARIFRAALADAFAALTADLIERFGTDVLGRELRLAPADLEAIAGRLLLERRTDEPLRLRVAAADAGTACDIPVVVDPLPTAGDAVLECRSGDIDARLPVRLAAYLAEAGR